MSSLASLAGGEALPTILYRVSEREVVHRAFWAEGAKAVVVAREAATRVAMNFMVLGFRGALKVSSITSKRGISWSGTSVR